MTRRILFTDAVSPEHVQRLQEAGCRVDIEPDMDYDTLLGVVAVYDALVVRSRFPIDRAVIDRGVRLRCIGRVGAGMETIDVDYAGRRGVCCLNSPEGNRDAVGEHTVGLMLALCDKIARADAEVRSGMWRREANRGMEVMGKTVGIIGFGNMGAAFARRLSGFGCQVLAYDILGLDATGFAQRMPHVRPATLQQVQSCCDILSLHVPLTDATFHLVDAAFLQRLAKPAVLINTSRGAVVDTDALADALRQGRLSGAALDVVEYENMERDSIASAEPEAWQYLKQSQRTVLTPHVAGWTVESKERLVATLVDKIIHTL